METIQELNAKIAKIESKIKIYESKIDENEKYLDIIIELNKRINIYETEINFLRTNAAINNSDRKRKQESPIESSDNSNKRICFCLTSKTTNSSSGNSSSCNSSSCNSSSVNCSSCNSSSRKNFSHSKPRNNFSEICKSFELSRMMGEKMKFLEKTIPIGLDFESFSWPNSNNFGSTNEKKDTEAARCHFVAQLDNFIVKSSIGESLNDLGFRLINVDLNEFKANLPGFGNGKPDLILLPYIGLLSPFDYCCVCIELKPVIKQQANNINSTKSYITPIYKTNKIKNCRGQSLLELLSASLASENPVLHITTDLDSTFTAMILTNTFEKNSIVEWDLTGEETISLIVYWIQNMCIKYTNERVIPNKSSVSNFSNIQIAKDHLKEKANRIKEDNDNWLKSLPETDSHLNCKQWESREITIPSFD